MLNKELNKELDLLERAIDISGMDREQVALGRIRKVLRGSKNSSPNTESRAISFLKQLIEIDKSYGVDSDQFDIWKREMLSWAKQSGIS